MINNFKKNIQEKLIEKMDGNDSIAQMEPHNAYSTGFMDCFNLIEKDIQNLLLRLDEIAHGEVFYSELPAVAKAALANWQWNKVDNFKKYG